jgi:glyoxylase-like metal-dependent hydrolase (beta-lactamase superfamily II)
MLLEIVEGVYQLMLPLPFRLREVHAYLIKGREGYGLVDCGINTQECFEALEKSLYEAGIEFSDIRSVFMTHYHSDHCGLAGRIKEISGASLIMEKSEALALEAFQETSPEQWHKPNFYLEHGMPAERFEEMRVVFPYLKSLISPLKIDECIGDGAEIKLGDLRFEAVWTPGHTPGHVCLYHPERKWLFCGDHILMRITPNVSLNSRSTLANPLAHYLDSLKKIIKLHADIGFPSHGALIKNPGERAQELILHHEERKNLILKALTESRKSAYELSLTLFGHRVSHFENWMAFAETLAHVVFLVSEERVKEIREEGHIWYQIRGM